MEIKTFQKSIKRNGGANGSKELVRFFDLLSQITDIIEDMLDKKEEYSDEFLKGLGKSLKEVKEKKLISIKSLAEL